MEFFVVVQCLQLAFIHIYRIVQFLLAKILFYYLSFSLRFLLCLQFACFYVKYALEAISLVYEMQFSMSPMLPPKCFFVLQIWLAPFKEHALGLVLAFLAYVSYTIAFWMWMLRPTVFLYNSFVCIWNICFPCAIQPCSLTSLFFVGGVVVGVRQAMTAKLCLFCLVGGNGGSLMKLYV